MITPHFSHVLWVKWFRNLPYNVRDFSYIFLDLLSIQNWMGTQVNSAVTRPWHLSRMWHSARTKIKTVPIERGKPWDNFHFIPDLSLLEWLGVDLRQLRSRVESHLWLDLTRLKSTSPSRLGTLRVGVAATLIAVPQLFLFCGQDRREGRSHLLFKRWN